MPSGVDGETLVTDKMDKFRFAVCRKDGRSSHPWAAWGNRSDFYIASRIIGSLVKVSLHEGGGFRLQFEKKYWEQMRAAGMGPSERAVVVWPKPNVPGLGAVHVASLIFPAIGFVADQPNGTSKKPMFLFEVADGEAGEIGLFYSREAIETLEPKLAKIGKPCGYTKLDDGIAVSTIARARDFDVGSLPTQIPANALLDESLHGSDTIESLHAVYWNDPRESGTLQMVEIGGVTLRRNR
jgi:hypothetical protein